ATSKIDTSNVVNESNVVLSDECLNVLSKGLKFIPTPLYINTVEVISNVEKSLSYVPLPFKRSAIAEISTFMLKWKKSQKSNMTKKELESLHELRRNNDIVIVPADKGGKIVVMNKCNYINKVEEKLNNVDLYEQVKDPTDTIKKKLSELTMRMFKNNKINAIQKLELMSIDNLAVGRIGIMYGGKKNEQFNDQSEAVKAFETLFLDKTGNNWSDRGTFKKLPSKFYPLEIDYGNHDIQKIFDNVNANKRFNLPKLVQDLICFIFDIESMEKALLSFEIDLTKIPLGRLSRNQLNKGYQAYSMLKETNDQKNEHSIDDNYKKLKCFLEPVDHNSEEFHRIEQYIANTSASHQRKYTLKLKELFKTTRESEREKFQKWQSTENRQLL
ncbi:unnamed protein product, partial [Rotaria sordida]